MDAQEVVLQRRSRPIASLTATPPSMLSYLQRASGKVSLGLWSASRDRSSAGLACTGASSVSGHVEEKSSAGAPTVGRALSEEQKSFGYGTRSHPCSKTPVLARPSLLKNEVYSLAAVLLGVARRAVHSPPATVTKHTDERSQATLQPYREKHSSMWHTQTSVRLPSFWGESRRSPWSGFVHLLDARAPAHTHSLNRLRPAC